MRKARDFCRFVDIVNEWTGRVVGVLIIIAILIITIELILRHVLNRPSIGEWDVNVYLMTVIIIIGAGYTLLYRGHVIVDIVVKRFSPRARALIDLVTSGFFFLGIGILLWQAILEAATSIEIKEHLFGIWELPFYPLRVIIAIGILLLLLQGIVKFVRDLVIALLGTEEVS